jgi:multidrug efflux pump subunit AcrB
MAILEADPSTDYARMDWQQRVQRVVPVYSETRGRWASVTRNDIASATKWAYDGLQVGLFREDDNQIPIVLRQVEAERGNVNGLPVLQILPDMSTDTVPLSQVTEGIITDWEDPAIRRRDRRRSIKIQANPVQGVTLPTLWASVAPDFEAVELPPGYELEWGGEYENTVDSQAALVPGIVPAVVIIAFIIVALYNAFRPLVIILLTIPLVLIGITAGLLAFNTPFGFMSLLGSMSLAGMMIKNIIVLLDQVEQELAAGKMRYQAVIDSALSRLRPVGLAAATTVLGVVPLLQDVFWVGMAVAIMAGLTFGTVLTMVIVPVLYAVLYNVPSPEGPPARLETAPQPA